MKNLHPGEEIIYEGHPSWRSILAYYIKGFIGGLIVAAIGYWLDGIGLAVGLFVLVFALVLIAGFFRRVATVYTVTTQRLRIKHGIVARHIQQTEIDRVQNVNTNQRPLERMLRVGMVDFDTAGTGNADFKFTGVDDPEEIVAAVDRAKRETAARGM
jgi:membrane protein YdbS with pleckstrin-like domain